MTRWKEYHNANTKARSNLVLTSVMSDPHVDTSKYRCESTKGALKRHLRVDGSDHIHRQTRPHVDTFFKRDEHECGLCHVERHLHNLSPLKQQEEKGYI